MTKDDKQQPAEGRRNFLKLAGVGAAVGAAAGATTAGAPKAQASVVGGIEKRGYQETAHVKQFYDTARF